MRLQLSNNQLAAIVVVLMFGVSCLYYYDYGWRTDFNLPLEPQTITYKRQVKKAVKQLFEDAQVKQVILFDDGGPRYKAAAFFEFQSGDSVRKESIYYLMDRNGKVIDFN